MPSPNLKLPYGRPKSLSDPYYDHGPEYCEKLLAKSDEELEWHDFQCLLGPHLPAGTYEESAYFLPFAFEFILAHDEHALDLVSALVGFVSINAGLLRSDGALDAARSQLVRCLEHWTSRFEVIHFDKDACQRRGFGRSYADYVRHSEVTMETTADLIRFKAHEDLAFGFFEELAAAESNAVKSAWFLESARRHAESDFSRPPRRGNIPQLLDNGHLRCKHAAVVCESFPGFSLEQTYWLDTFALLGTDFYG